MSADDAALTRVHERLDEISGKLGIISETVILIESRCGPCRDEVRFHEELLRGNGGRNGIMTRLKTLEDRGCSGSELLEKDKRYDVLSVKSVCILLGAVGALMTTIGAVIGTVIASIMGS